MTRAVIELSEDLIPVMSRVSSLIEGCAYNPETNLMGFNYKGMGVIVESKKITINNAEDEATAREVMNWLLNKINGISGKVTKQEVG